MDTIKWHPAFAEAIRIILAPYKDVLSFENEHELTSAPLKIDLMVIKKNKDVQIELKIGKIFLTFNVLEYKGPGDYLSLSDFYKVYAYVCLYIAFEKIDIKDITLTFSLSNYPMEVFKHLKEVRKYKITKKHHGIYYVEDDIIPIQFILNSELDDEENIYLNSLTKALTVNKVKALLAKLSKKETQASVTAFTDAIMRGNLKIFMEALKMDDLKEMAESIKDTPFAHFFENIGREEGLRLTATNLKKTGMSLKQIADITGLPIDELERL
jgi:hypothetical protein